MRWRRGSGVAGVGGVIIAMVMAMLAGAPAIGTETLSGPIVARVIKVLDGDTLHVRAFIWLDQEITTKVRLLDIDAPELKGRCAGERALAKQARSFVMQRVLGRGKDQFVQLRDLRHDKYAGRVLARVLSSSGEDLGAALLAAGLARPYKERKRRQWCQTH